MAELGPPHSQLSRYLAILIKVTIVAGSGVCLRSIVAQREQQDRVNPWWQCGLQSLPFWEQAHSEQSPLEQKQFSATLLKGSNTVEVR